MPVYQLNFAYTQAEKGWSEIYYITQPDLAGVKVQVGIGLQTAMVNFRNQLTRLQSCRISDIANNRTTVVQVIGRNGTNNGLTADVASTAGIVTLKENLFLGTRKVWLRGISDSDVVRLLDGNDNPSPGFILGMANYFDAIAFAGLQIRSLVKIQDPPIGRMAKTSILSIAGLAQSGVVSLTTELPAAFIVGDRVKISQMSPKDFPGLNGLYKVKAVANNGLTFTVEWNPPTALAQAVVKGKVRPVVYNYGVISANDCTFYSFAPHKTGKNPRGGRGARSALRLRHAQ